MSQISSHPAKEIKLRSSQRFLCVINRRACHAKTNYALSTCPKLTVTVTDTPSATGHLNDTASHKGPFGRGASEINVVGI